MTFFILMTVAVVVTIATTLRSVFHDAPAARPLSHHVDPDFLAPGSRLRHDRAA